MANELPEKVFKTARRLLPKYGGVPSLALIQATILHRFDPPWTEELVTEFERWLRLNP